MRILEFSALAVSAFLLASCAGSAQNVPGAAGKKEAESEAKLCQNMSKRASALQEYPEVTGETSLEELKEANEKVERAVREVQRSAQKTNHPGILEVQAAFQELQNDVNSIPGGRATVGNASSSVNTSAQELRAAWSRLYSNMQCGA